MRRARHSAVGLIVALWAAAMGLLFALPRPPFDLEAYLLRDFPPSHLDA
jgi:hypothetical protein